MDDVRFDLWTRRGFGLAAGSLFAALLALASVDDVMARKKRKRRCTKHEKRCGKKCIKGSCCPGKACGELGESCECGRTVEGKSFCFTALINGVCLQCESSAACEGEFQCVKTDECGGVTAICHAPCGFVPSRTV